MTDPINPAHYRRGSVEAIDVIESAVSDAPHMVPAYLQGQALKYLLRMWCKGNAQVPLVYRSSYRQTGGMMTRLPGLNLIERLALRILTRSRNTGLVVVKPYGYPCVFVASDGTDPVAAYVTDGPDEPASMVLERIYHQPAAGELE